MSNCSCEGSCPACFIGEVDNHKCNRCEAEFCPECHGITNNVKSENVLPCECRKKRTKEAGEELVVKEKPAMAKQNETEAAFFKRINEILEARYAGALKDMMNYVTVQCEVCRHNFFFNCISEPKIDHGFISDAHGVVKGYQFRFPCPNCGVLLRVDEDEIELRAWAKPDEQHS